VWNSNQIKNIKNIYKNISAIKCVLPEQTYGVAVELAEQVMSDC
jgi:hypothetical protein